MSNDVIDRLRRVNPHDSGDVPALTQEREALILHAARTELSGPLRRSWLVAALIGLLLGIGGTAIWFGVAPTAGPVADGEPTEAPVTSTAESLETPPVETVGPPPFETPETTGAPGVGPIVEITPMEVQCSTQLNDTSLACDNLIDGTSDYWNDNSLRGEGAVITVTFAGPVQLEQIQFLNIQDDPAFRRNYRIRGVKIIPNDLPGLPFIAEIPNDNDRPHAVTAPTLATTQLVIRIASTWPAESIDGRAFDELALEEIRFWGRNGPRLAEADPLDIVSLEGPAGYVAVVVQTESGPCILITNVEANLLAIDQDRCLDQPGPPASAVAFQDLPIPTDMVIAGFADADTTVTIELEGQVLSTTHSGTLWMFVTHNPDFAREIAEAGTVVMRSPDGSIVAELDILSLEVP